MRKGFELCRRCQVSQEMATSVNFLFALPLQPKSPTQFDRNQIALGNDADVRVGDNTLPATVPKDKQIVARSNRPAQPRVGSDIL